MKILKNSFRLLSSKKTAIIISISILIHAIVRGKFYKNNWWHEWNGIGEFLGEVFVAYIYGIIDCMAIIAVIYFISYKILGIKQWGELGDEDRIFTLIFITIAVTSASFWLLGLWGLIDI